MTTTTLTIDQLEGEFAEGDTLLWNHKFYTLLGELFTNTDPRVIHAVTLTVIEGNDGDLESSQVRRVVHALENGFDNQAYFLRTFNEEYPIDESTDLDDRAEWENTALVIKRGNDRDTLFWGFEVYE